MHGPSYGLEIMARVKELTNGEVELQQGMVYPVLEEFEAKGLLKGQTEPPTADPRTPKQGRPRRYYRITPAGEKKARAEAWAVMGLFLKSLEAVDAMRDEQLL